MLYFMSVSGGEEKLMGKKKTPKFLDEVKT